jgi:tetratricopeptide (TPR) repeat protein
LRSLSLSAGKTSEAGNELAKDDCHQQEEPLAIGRCFYAKARDLLKAEEYDRAIRIYEYIIQILTPVQEDMTAQGLPFSDLTILLANSWLSKGDALAMQDKYEDAIQAYDEAIRLDPDNDDAWRLKGLTLDKMGRYDKAISAYDQALLLNPYVADTWYQKGLALEKLGRTTDANEAIAKAEELSGYEFYP